MTVFWHEVLSCMEEKCVVIQSKIKSLQGETKLIINLQVDVQYLKY